jgi:hypothetical protein
VAGRINLDFLCRCHSSPLLLFNWIREALSTPNRARRVRHLCFRIGDYDGIIIAIKLMKVLATICLFPVDIALVSSTVDRNTGLRKHWATPERVSSIVFSLKVVYYGTLRPTMLSSPVCCRRTVLSINYPVQLFLV